MPRLEHHPKTIAIVGASRDRTKHGNKAVRGFHRRMWKVYPINPQATSIEGIKAYPSVDALPEDIDIAAVYLGPNKSLPLLEEMAEKGVKKIYFSPGAEHEIVFTRAHELGMVPISACPLRLIGEDVSSIN